MWAAPLGVSVRLSVILEELCENVIARPNIGTADVEFRRLKRYLGE